MGWCAVWTRTASAMTGHHFEMNAISSDSASALYSRVHAIETGQRRLRYFFALRVLTISLVVRLVPT